ncbi:hypothetical protein H072_1484 [Dactylellina haptotyla CBS 200.50]|uniref:Uncharacterized protein n=1 Tax=Dactylellina haptotyla (strain CBS 200.50) TaxID=1284197 RepID=S8ANS6_DACHA|nr:hypothetical protein H072_1484 [Dactylellina haptotyla CBS 200.50]
MSSNDKSWLGGEDGRESHEFQQSTTPALSIINEGIRGSLQRTILNKPDWMNIDLTELDTVLQDKDNLMLDAGDLYESVVAEYSLQLTTPQKRRHPPDTQNPPASPTKRSKGKENICPRDNPNGVEWILQHHPDLIVKLPDEPKPSEALASDKKAEQGDRDLKSCEEYIDPWTPPDGKIDYESQEIHLAIEMSKKIFKHNLALTYADQQRVQQKVDEVSASFQGTAEAREKAIERVKDKARMEISWEKTVELCKRIVWERANKLTWEELQQKHDEEEPQAEAEKEASVPPSEISVTGMKENIPPNLEASQEDPEPILVDSDIKPNPEDLAIKPAENMSLSQQEEPKPEKKSKQLVVVKTAVKPDAKPGIPAKDILQSIKKPSIAAQGDPKPKIASHPRKETLKPEKKTTFRAGDGLLTFNRLEQFNKKYKQGHQNMLAKEQRMREDIRKNHREQAAASQMKHQQGGLGPGPQSKAPEAKMPIPNPKYLNKVFGIKQMIDSDPETRYAMMKHNEFVQLNDEDLEEIPYSRPGEKPLWLGKPLG